MLTNDTNGKECTGPEWESVGRELLDRELRVRAGYINEKLYAIAEAVKAGEDVDPADLRAAREHLDMAIDALETHIGPTRGGVIVTEFEYDRDDYPCIDIPE